MLSEASGDRTLWVLIFEIQVGSSHIRNKFKVLPDGLEPPALRLLAVRSNQLSYGSWR